MTTLEQVVEQLGDWAEDPLATNLETVQRVQAHMLADLDRVAGRQHVRTAVVDYLRAMAVADPSDPDVAQWCLTHRGYSVDMMYDVIAGWEKVPRPRGRPALAEDQQRRQWDIRLTPAEVATIDAAAARADLAPRVWARQQLLQAARPTP